LNIHRASIAAMKLFGRASITGKITVWWMQTRRVSHFGGGGSGGGVKKPGLVSFLGGSMYWSPT